MCGTFPSSISPTNTPMCLHVCNRGTDNCLGAPRCAGEAQTAACATQINQMERQGKGLAWGTRVSQATRARAGKTCTSIVGALSSRSPSPHTRHTSQLPQHPTNQPTNPPKTQPSCQPGRLLRLFLEPKSLTLEKTFNLFLSQLPLLLLGLLTHLQALDFSRSLACLFWRIRELAMAAAMAATAPAAGAGQGNGGRWPGVASMLLGSSPRPGTMPLGDAAPRGHSLPNATTLGRSARTAGRAPQPRSAHKQFR